MNLQERKQAVQSAIDRQSAISGAATAKPAPVVRTYVFNPTTPMSTAEQMEYAVIVAAEIATALRLNPNKGALTGAQLKPGTDRKVIAAAYIGNANGTSTSLELYETKNDTPKLVIKGVELAAQYLEEGWSLLKESGQSQSAVA